VVGETPSAVRANCLSRPYRRTQRFGRFWKLDPPTEVGREKFEGDVPAGLFAAGTTLTPVGGPPPNIAFAGFRFIRVQDGAISVMRYISLDELRASDFKLPWVA
jgi:hypothetical protein